MDEALTRVTPVQQSLPQLTQENKISGLLLKQELKDMMSSNHPSCSHSILHSESHHPLSSPCHNPLVPVVVYIPPLCFLQTLIPFSSTAFLPSCPIPLSSAHPPPNTAIPMLMRMPASPLQSVGRSNHMWMRSKRNSSSIGVLSSPSKTPSLNPPTLSPPSPSLFSLHIQALTPSLSLSLPPPPAPSPFLSLFPLLFHPLFLPPSCLQGPRSKASSWTSGAPRHPRNTRQGRVPGHSGPHGAERSQGP